MGGISGSGAGLRAGHSLGNSWRFRKVTKRRFGFLVQTDHRYLRRGYALIMGSGQDEHVGFFLSQGLLAGKWGLRRLMRA